MPTVKAPAKVLVTGANGFVAVWLVRHLLERGYLVRGTVRSESKTVHLRRVFEDEIKKGQLEFLVVSDMTANGAFDEAVRGVEAILHTASPAHAGADDPNELIGPAVAGTVGILESALKSAGSQLKRVVITASCASVINAPYTGTFDEHSWNDAAIADVKEKGKAASDLSKYRASKTLSEKAAWEFVSKNESKLTWDLVTINPPFIFGPVLSEASTPSALATSMSFFYDALFSKTKKLEDILIPAGEWADVRDVAEGHVRALEVPEASGERFILSEGRWTWQDWFDAANEAKIPGATFPAGAPGSAKEFPFAYRYDSKKARSVLGMVFRDKVTTAKDIIEDFKARGW